MLQETCAIEAEFARVIFNVDDVCCLCDGGRTFGACISRGCLL